MAKIQRDQPLVPSVLDRLLDDQPDVSREPVKPRHQMLRELQEAVRRDLENLLNTRARVGNLPSDLLELQKSVVHYGLPDFRSINIAIESGRDQLRALI